MVLQSCFARAGPVLPRRSGCWSASR